MDLAFSHALFCNCENNLLVTAVHLKTLKEEESQHGVFKHSSSIDKSVPFLSLPLGRTELIQ